MKSFHGIDANDDSYWLIQLASTQWIGSWPWLYVNSLYYFCVKYKIYSNKVVKHLTHLTQHVPQNKPIFSLCYPLASYKLKDLAQHCNICDQLVCWSFQLAVNPVGCWRAGTCTKRNMLTEVDHIGHKFVKYCRVKLAGSVMKHWLYFVARVGWSELDVWPFYLNKFYTLHKITISCQHMTMVNGLFIAY